MERLTAEDRLMLWPDERWFQVEAARQAVGARLHRVPRLRQVLQLPRPGLGGPPRYANAAGRCDAWIGTA